MVYGHNWEDLQEETGLVAGAGWALIRFYLWNVELLKTHWWTLIRDNAVFNYHCILLFEAALYLWNCKPNSNGDFRFKRNHRIFECLHPNIPSLM